VPPAGLSNKERAKLEKGAVKLGLGTPEEIAALADEDLVKFLEGEK
jgi:hypothetical protein